MAWRALVDAQQRRGIADQSGGTPRLDDATQLLLSRRYADGATLERTTDGAKWA